MREYYNQSLVTPRTHGPPLSLCQDQPPLQQMAKKADADLEDCVYLPAAPFGALELQVQCA